MRGLGELERRVMDVLWTGSSPRTVRDVHDEIVASRPIAYTTVLTVLDNLHGKGWADRERRGRSWVYRPTRTREEAGAEALREVLVASGDPEGVLLHFARAMNRDESDFLRQVLEEREQG